MADQKKGIFDKLFGKKEDAKDKIEEVAKDVKSEAEIAAENAKRVAEAAAKKAETEARKAEYEAQKVAKEAEAKIDAAREALDESKEAAKEKLEALGSKKDNLAKDVSEKAAAAYIDNYTVQANDTLSHIAARFYGKATPAYYTLIFEHNKDVIGDNMNLIKAGQVLRIPTLPDELK